MKTDLNLEDLIVQYAENKYQLDALKSVCDTDNKLIKAQMAKQNLTDKTAGGYIAKRVIQTRESFNEDKLLAIFKSACADGRITKETRSAIIETKEYINFDALENAIYQGDITKDILLELDSAKEIKTVETLRISKIKKGKEDGADHK